MQTILHTNFYNIGKYLVQTMSQVKSSGITLAEVHDIGKGLDLIILSEKQVNKPIVTSKTKVTSQIKPRLGQGRAGLRQKIQPLMPH